MSTRGAIARLNGDGFKGVYHHWDSYPTALGATLYKLYNGFFKRDLDTMLKTLIDDHPAGWSTINGANFSQPCGFEENGFRTSGGHCYCHGGRHEKGWTVTDKNVSGSGVEYVYVFNETGRMAILSSYNGDNTKMIGAFGMGNPDAKWRPIAVVDLNEEEPEWDNLEKEGE